MRKIILFVFVLTCTICLAGCASKSDNNLMELSEVCALVAGKGYTEENFQEKLSGQSREDVIYLWGDPDGMLSGFWGDIWYLGDESKQIILYYDKDGVVETVRVMESSI